MLEWVWLKRHVLTFKQVERLGVTFRFRWYVCWVIFNSKWNLVITKVIATEGEPTPIREDGLTLHGYAPLWGNDRRLLVAIKVYLYEILEKTDVLCRCDCGVLI